MAEDPVPKNFTPQYTPAVVDNEARTIYIRLTNKYVPPESPSEPEPSEPAEEIPDDPTPSGAPSSGAEPSENEEEESPDESTPLAPGTGERSGNSIWFAMGTALAACWVTSVVLCKRRRKSETESREK